MNFSKKVMEFEETRANALLSKIETGGDAKWPSGGKVCNVCKVDEVDEVNVLRSLLSTFEEMCEVECIHIHEKEAYIEYTLKDYDLIDADLDYDVIHYQKLCVSLRETLIEVLKNMIKSNTLRYAKIKIFKEWKRGSKRNEYNIYLENKGDHLSKGIFTFEPLVM